MKRSRRSSFLIRDLLSPGGSGHLSPVGSRGLAYAHLRGTPQINLALSRPSLTRIFAHPPPYFPVGYTCPSCPAWTSGPCLGLIHGKCFFSNKAGIFSGDVNRFRNVAEPPYPLPIPLPVYVRSRASESPPPGSGKIRKSRRSRTVFTELQLMGLERRFDKQKYLSTPDRIELADTLGLSQIQVKTWYQNRRMKWKKQVLSAGGTEAPTKPKGRPKKNSIPSAEELQASLRQDEQGSDTDGQNKPENNTAGSPKTTITGQIFDT